MVEEKHRQQRGGALASGGDKKVTNVCARKRGVTKLGVDVHSGKYVIVAQFENAQPTCGAAFFSAGVCAVGGVLLRERGKVHAVYEACGFGFVCFGLR